MYVKPISPYITREYLLSSKWALHFPMISDMCQVSMPLRGSLNVSSLEQLGSLKDIIVEAKIITLGHC